MAVAFVAKSPVLLPGHLGQLLQKPADKRHRILKIQSPPLPHTRSAQKSCIAATGQPPQIEETKDQRKGEQKLAPSENEAPRDRRRPALITRNERRGMGRRSLLGKGLLAAVSCPLCLQVQSASAAEWNYGGPSGPIAWGGLCAIGRQQSPVNIRLKGSQLKLGALGELQFDYHAADVTILNTGHGTMQVNFPTGTTGSSSLKVGTRTLDLLQFHFHSPSEHAMDGERYDMEAHMVHKDRESGTLGVIGTLLQAVPDVEAAPNPALAAALELAPRERGALKAAEICTPICGLVKVSAEDLIPTSLDPDDADARNYFHYQGSLTTPPCSEGVDWFLMGSPIKIPDTQLVAFMKYVGNRKTLGLNSRPLQPMRAREITRGPA